MIPEKEEVLFRTAVLAWLEEWREVIELFEEMLDDFHARFPEEK